MRWSVMSLRKSWCNEMQTLLKIGSVIFNVGQIAEIDLDNLSYNAETRAHERVVSVHWITPGPNGGQFTTRVRGESADRLRRFFASASDDDHGHECRAIEYPGCVVLDLAAEPADVAGNENEHDIDHFEIVQQE